MKKVLALLIILIVIIGVLVVGSQNNKTTNVNSESDVTVGSEENDAETTVQREEPLSREDFYLYKEVFDGSGYTYRQDGQILTIFHEGNETEIESEFIYDENGMLKMVKDQYFGDAYFDYVYFGDFYVGEATYERGDVSLRYTYDDNYTLVKREQIRGSDIITYEALYNEDGNIIKTVESETGWHTIVKKFNDKGVLIREEEYSNDGELIFFADYDSKGILKKENG